MTMTARPTTRRDLWLLILEAFGVALPARRFMPGHSSPFDFVADAFFHDDRDVAAWACRSGGKTLGASLIAALDYFPFSDGHTTGLQGRVLSGSEDQAKNLYEYWAQWCSGALAERLDGDVHRQLTRIGGGRFEILAASQKRVRGPKVQRLYEDELDEIDVDIDAAAVGMIDSRPGLPGRTVYTSTWHRAAGPMGLLVDGCPGNGVSLHRWNLWESIQKCPPERHEAGAGCDDCPLAPECFRARVEAQRRPGARTGLASDACGLYRIEDACKAFQKVSRSVWESEYLCKRPSVEGLVYPDFDAQACMVDAAPSDLTVYRVIDWGLNVFVCLWVGEAKDGTSYVLDTYRAQEGTLAQHAAFINAHPLGKARDTYCDPAGRSRNDQTGKSNIDVFKSHGIPCTYKSGAHATNVQNGIRAVRDLILTASGVRRLCVVQNENNRMFIRAMQSYVNRKVNGVWIDDPQDPQEFEHVPDALRYYVVNRTMPAGITRVPMGAA